MPARLARIFSNGVYQHVPPAFVMAFPSASLLFDARLDEAAGTYDDAYSVYRLPAGETRVVRPSTEAVGRIPVSDVEFDETRGLIVKTSGIERFL